MAEEEPFADTTLKCKQADSPRKKDKSVWHANRFKLEKAQLQIHTNSKRWKDPELRSSAAVVTTLGLRPWIQSGNMVCMLTKLDFCVFLCKSLKIFEPFWWFPNNVFLSDLKSSFGKWLLPTVCIVFYWLGLLAKEPEDLPQLRSWKKTFGQFRATFLSFSPRGSGSSEKQLVMLLLD